MNNNVRNFLKLFRITALLCTLGIILACSNAPAVPTQTVETTTAEVTSTPPFNLVTIPVGLDLNQPYQMLPYYLETRQGHYLLYLIESQVLFYDGEQIHAGELADLYGFGMSLSENGLHYAYIIPGSDGANFRDLYVDGVKVATAEYLRTPAVTNDGQNYFYTACMSGTGFSDSCLFKNDKDIFTHSGGILDYFISQDGSVFLASLRNIDSNGVFTESLVLNRKEIYWGGELKDKLLSPSGNHYAYISIDDARMQHLIVDGVEQTSSMAMALLQVTDQGSYCYWDADRSEVGIDQKRIPVSHEKIQCFITEDASHALIYDGGWYLDGEPVNLPDVRPEDKIWGVEMRDDVWYVYRLVESTN